MTSFAPRSLVALASLAFVLPAHAADTLRDQTSAYLRQHYDEPVHWMPWGEAALARAKTENKPIYVCVGAFTSELTRAMHKQSFRNAQIAETLNNEFVCILVDRDERPDLATLFASYVQAAKQVSGWPVNVWLTPDLKPFDGATYLPPSEEWGKEGIANVVKRILAAWHSSPESFAAKAEEGASNAAASELTDAGPAYSAEKAKAALTKATAAWLEKYDATHGGFGEAPRFAEPELLRFLLRTPGPSREAAVATLRALNRSALHDPLDGGFYHRSVDATWQFPSFQKFLGDQARIALAYLDAAQITGDVALAKPARDALDYAILRLNAKSGGYIHAEDATPEEIALGYGWTSADLAAVLGEKDAAEFGAELGVKAEGNVAADNDPASKWKGKNVLFLASTASDEKQTTRFASARAKLLAERDQRAAALRDENVIVGENGLLLAALARAGEQLKASQYTEAAKKLATLLREKSRDPKSDSLVRLIGSSTPAAADDYAFMALGLAALGAKDEAAALLKTQQRLFLDEKSGRFFAQRADAPTLWVRPRLIDPNPGDLPAAETATILAQLQQGAKAGEIPHSLLGYLMAALDDPNGAPRGDVVLAAALVSE